MAEPIRPRPVSGEILPAGAPTRGPSVADAVDADFTTVQPPEPSSVASRRPAVDAPPLDGMGALRGDRAAALPPAGKRRAGPLFWIVGGLVAVMAFWSAGGHALFELPTRAPEPAAALAIGDVVSRVDAAGPKPLLFVEGRVVNAGTADGTPGRIAIDVAGHDGAVTRYILGTGTEPLVPGAEFPFSGRLPAPKSGVKTVSVTFVDEER